VESVSGPVYKKRCFVRDDDEEEEPSGIEYPSLTSLSPMPETELDRHISTWLSEFPEEVAKFPVPPNWKDMDARSKNDLLTDIRYHISTSHGSSGWIYNIWNSGLTLIEKLGSRTGFDLEGLESKLSVPYAGGGLKEEIKHCLKQIALENNDWLPTNPTYKLGFLLLTGTYAIYQSNKMKHQFGKISENIDPQQKQKAMEDTLHSEAPANLANMMNKL